MPKIAIIYASRTGKTKKMAEAIANGAKTIEGTEVVLKDVFKAVPNDVLNVNAIVLGGSTYNNELIKTMDPFLDELEKLDLKGKVGAAFGSHGWSGEGVPALIDRMRSFGMLVIEPGTTAVQVPTKEDIEKCFQLGKTMANDLIN
ncbi:MAG: flavodoxin domain-containing protein [Methanothrix sp.]|nr:flavodoxin domain-containing protein [Methanothrix sp.]